MSADLLPGQPVSLWRATTYDDPRPTAPPGHLFEIAIIGGGIAGIMAAYELVRAGKKVAVLEADRILCDVTGNTTAKLTSQHGLIYHYLLETFGIEHATHYYEANEWAIKRVHQLAAEHRIECDFRWDSANVFVALPENRPKIDLELEACQKLNIPAEEILQPLLPFDNYGAVRFPQQARYHPLKFLYGIVRQLEAMGVPIFEDSRVLEVDEQEDRVRLETAHGDVFADHVIVATNYPIHDSGSFVAKLAPYRSYALAMDVKGALPDGMYVSFEEDPLYSLRRAEFEDREVLIVGGEMNKVGHAADTEGSVRRLEAWARTHFDVAHILFRWAAQDNFTPDGLPYVGPSPHRSRISVATGFGGWGMTNGVAAAKILADQIVGEFNPWANTYRPSRVDWAMIPKLVKENFAVAKNLLGDRIARGDSREYDELGVEEAAIIQNADERVAAYRDGDGALHVVTSACTHMGCQLHWNSAELSWDCPCHGSRFTIDGEIIHGPAVKPLERRI